MVLYYKKRIKISLKILFITAFMFCFYCIIKYPLQDEYLLTLPVIVACIYGWLYIYFFKIEITADSLVQYGIKKQTSIKYDEVTAIGIYIDHLIIKSKNSKIKVTSDLENQTEGIAFVLNKLKPRKKELNVKGAPNFVNGFLS